MPFGPQITDETVFGVRFKTIGAEKVEHDSQRIAKATIKGQSLITKAIKLQDVARKKLAVGIKQAYLLSTKNVRGQIAANLENHRSLVEIQKQVKSNAKAVQQLTEQEKASTGETKKAFEEKRKALELEGKQLDGILQKTREAVAGGKEGAKALAAYQKIREDTKKKKEEVYDKFLSYKAGEDIGAGFKEAIQGLGSRDMKGMAGGLLKALGSAPKGLGAMAKRFEARKMADPEAGKMGKVLGSLAGTLGNVVGMFAKLAPLLSMVGGAVMAIVKLFMDAEAAAKEFNKEVMATSSSAEILAVHGGKAEEAYSDLRDTMDQLRNAANDLEKNMEMGISKKQHQEFLSTLGAEGVSIRQIQKDAKAAKMEIGEFSTEMVHTAVAYSRVWGVSLSEITQLQGEMISEFGMGLESVQQNFKMMSNAASESGIAANKFFSIIRSFTADMSLFNLRMEDAVLTLKMLGKAMSPRNAQKFMQTITGFYKNQGLVERTGTVLKAGGPKKVGGMLQKGVTSRITGMSNDVAAKIGDAGAAKELQDAIKKGPEATSKFIAKHQDKIDGNTREAIYDAARMQGKLNKGGLVDVASAVKDASPQETMDLWDMQAKQFFGKPVDELTDVERLAFEQLSGVTDEMQDQAAKARQSTKQLKEDLATKIETGGDLTEEQTAMAKAMGLKGSKEEQAAEVRAKSDSELWGTMTALQRKQAMGTDDVKDYAKEQTKMLDTVADKLERILDWLMNQLYNAMVGIWDIIADMFGTKTQKVERDIQRNVQKTKDPELMKALKDSAGETSGDFKKFREELVKSNTYQNGVLGILDGTAKTDQEIAAKQDFMKRLTQKMSKTEMHQAAKLAFQQGKLTKEQVFAVESAADQSEEAGLAAIQALPLDQQTAILKEIPNALAPEKLAAIFPDIKKDVQGAFTAAGYSPQEQSQMGVLDPEVAKTQTDAQQKATAALDAVNASLDKALKASGQRIGSTTAVHAEDDPAGPISGKTAEATAEATQQTVNAVQAQTDAMTSPTTVFFKFPLPYLRGPFTKAMKGAVEDGSLKSLRTALFEYWQYSDLDKTKAAEWIKAGGTPEDFGQQVQESFAKTGKLDIPEPSATVEGGTAPGHAAGGVVAGVAGGMAVVKRPAPGEGFASIGKGEGITPAGGGGGSVVRVKLELSQDLKRVIRAEAADTVYEGKRRERFTG